MFYKTFSGTTRLGMGDFIFYSLLVGKAASNGSVFATIAAIFDILLGLIITLTLASDYEDSLPALPISVCLGAAFHFGVLFGVQPFVEFVVFELLV